MTQTPSTDTARVPGVDSPGMKPRPPFNGKRGLYNVVPVRFERSLVTDLYNAGELFLPPGTPVVVDTVKGPALAEVSGVVERRVMDKGRVRRVIRRATREDIERHAENRESARDAFRFCLQRIRTRDLSMKLCQVEYMLDRSRILFYFSAEQRVDFRQLVRDLARQLDARIEMRQIGVRDGAGIIGGIGPCGKELCCSSFLKSFRSVSIRHAKDQGLPLNPKKVSGMCGRLMCCLVYEHPTYRKARSSAPRINRAVETHTGRGVITEVHLLQRQVRVLLEGGAVETLPFSQVIVDNERILRPHDIATAPPSRPRRSAAVTRAGSNLREDYVWDGAEADHPAIVTEATTEIEASQANQESGTKQTASDADSGKSPRKRRRGSRRRRRGSRGGKGKDATADGSAGDARPKQRTPSPTDSGSERKSDTSANQTKDGGRQQSKGQAEGDRPSGSKTRRRRRRPRRRSKDGGDTSGGGQSGGGHNPPA